MDGLKQRSVGRSWLARGLGLVFPPSCAYCEADLETPAGLSLCDACQRSIAGGRPPACPRCGSSIPETAANQADCAQCRRHRPAFDAVARLGRYRDDLRKAVLRMKHGHEEHLAHAVGELLWQHAGGEIAAMAPSVVAPIPMHWRRRWSRGTNSPETLSTLLASRLQVPHAPRMLARRRNTEPQGTLSRTARIENLRHAFRLRWGYDVRQLRVLLVDDILTTGTTASEAARVLKQAGAEFVGVAVAARAEGLDA